MTWVVVVLTGYLLGSIPTSLWVGRAFYGVDIRQQGSGSAGGTNMFRVVGWKPALFVFVVDLSKGLIPVWAIGHWQVGSLRLQLLTGAAAVIGHVWPVWAGFRGGKGIATLAGVLLAINPASVVIGLVVFVLAFSLTRYVSLSSMMAALSLPCSLWFQRNIPDALLIAGGLAVPFVFFTHRANIKRLLAGVENRMGRA